MSKVAIVGDPSGTGTFTISAPNGNTDRTLVLPDEAGTVLTSASDVAQKGVPAFRVYPTASASTASSTWTKIALNAITFDADANFDTTNYKFQPTVAGYYFFGWTADLGGSFTLAITQLYKNGTGYSRAAGVSVAHNEIYSTGTALVYLNGTSDYVELYAYTALSSGAGTIYGGALITHLHGTLVRAD